MKKKLSPLFIESRVLRLGKECRYKQGHSHQVARLALSLFDQLSPLHRLNSQSRYLLRWSSLLHDIGWLNGRQRHHKSSRDIILKTRYLPFAPRDRKVVALTARYHRRALPKNSHKCYGNLSAVCKKEINVLASFLRIADGLDRQHINSVRILDCRVSAKNVTLVVFSNKFSEEERRAALKKSDLFKKVFKRTLAIRQNQIKI